ncbi:MAG: hypothetical protein ABSA33_00300 [Candidatus Micrarchaeaceae archaeon]|jgi:hypothetical protein
MIDVQKPGKDLSKEAKSTQEVTESIAEFCKRHDVIRANFTLINGHKGSYYAPEGTLPSLRK